MPDVSETLTPKSDQLNAIELLGEERTYRILRVDVRPGAEQPISIHLEGLDRAWKPCLSMRRVLRFCYGKESDDWVGHRVTLFGDERVSFGGVAVGGIRIKALSGIRGPRTIPLPASKGRAVPYPVQALPDAPAAPVVDETAAKIAALGAEWKTADAERRAAIETEVAELKGGAA